MIRLLSSIQYPASSIQHPVSSIQYPFYHKLSAVNNPLTIIKINIVNNRFHACLLKWSSIKYR